MIAMLLLLVPPQAVDTVDYASPALRALIARAEAANAAPPPALRGYTARYESEVALAKRLPERVEGSSTIEQTAGTFTWAAGAGFGQHQDGYRVRTTGVPLPGSAALSNGWIVPTLSGPRYHLFGANSGAQTTAGLDSSGVYAAWSPVGPDRDRYYRFAGGDTVTMKFPDGSTGRVIRIEVTPRGGLPDREKVFRGDLYLDPGTLAVRRVRGQFLTVGGPPPQGRAKRLNKLVVNAAVADLVTTEVPGAGWIPTYQRFELEVLIPLTTESWSTLRVMTSFRDVRPVIDAGAQVPPYIAGRSAASKDSLAAYREWWNAPDQEVNAVQLGDLVGVGPPAFRPDGPPIYFWRGPTTLQALRFNRVEGLYTGLSGTLRLRDAMPGLEIRGTGGYAWWPGLFRGGVKATLARGEWTPSAEVMRDLDLVTKFPDPLDYNRGVRAAFQQDNYDYVDRTVATAGLTRWLSSSGPSNVSVNFGWVQDRSTPANLNYGPLGQSYTINPNVFAYNYPRLQLSVNWHPQISSHFTQPGVALSASYEQGWGSRPYQRIQGGIVVRANYRSATLTIVGDIGYTRADSFPTQQMFLIGGSGTMPGYDYDQFGGNFATLARTMIAFPLPLLQAPLQFGKATVPAIAPNLSFRLYSGHTENTTDAAAVALNNVGTQSVNGMSVPFSVASNGLQQTFEARISVFGNLLGFGLATPLGPDAHWTFQFAFAQSF